MSSFREELMGMDEEGLKKHIEGVVAIKLQKDKRLSEESGRMWGEIVGRTLEFNRRKIETEELSKLGKEDVVEFWDKYLVKGAPLRRKMATHVVSSKHQGEKVVVAEGGAEGQEAKDESGGSGILLLSSMEEVRALKRNLPLFPPRARQD